MNVWKLPRGGTLLKKLMKVVWKLDCLNCRYVSYNSGRQTESLVWQIRTLQASVLPELANCLG